MTPTPLTDENERFLPGMREGITSAAFTRNLERELRMHTGARHNLLDQLEELKQRNQVLQELWVNERRALENEIKRLERLFLDSGPQQRLERLWLATGSQP